MTILYSEGETVYIKPIAVRTLLKVKLTHNRSRLYYHLLTGIRDVYPLYMSKQSDNDEFVSSGGRDLQYSLMKSVSWNLMFQEVLK